MFTSLSRMLRHDRKTHTREQDYECKICEAEVTDINVHMRVRKNGEFFFSSEIARTRAGKWSEDGLEGRDRPRF